MKQLMISLLLLLSCFSVLAQEKTANREVKKVKKLYALYGGTYDSFTRMPLGAKVFLMLKDSTIVDTLSAEVYNKDSFFKFPVERFAGIISSKQLIQVISIHPSTILLSLRAENIIMPCLRY